MIILLLILLSFKYPTTNEPLDRWLVELKSTNSQCLDEWWIENGFDRRPYLKKILPIENWMVVGVPENFSTSLRQLPCIQSIEIDQVLENRSTIPNDPEYTNQSDMDLIGMPEAWDLTTGGLTVRGDTIVVAVIDDGFQLDHEDLKENIWHNPGEIPNDGIDNDNNGYVDDYYGVNILKGNDNHDILHHGTSVCGIIGATGNNLKGISGINWNVKLMVISYDFHVSTLAEAYQYVVDMRKKYNESKGKEGAFVVAVNLSSGREYAHPKNYPIWCSMYDKLGEVGVIGVCSASNNHHNADQQGDLPTLCISPYTLIVTNIGPDDHLVDDAGYGRISVDLGAPGEHCLTTDIIDNYTFFTGTSSAAPHVAGAVALLYSALCPNQLEILDEDPSAFALRIKNIILSSGTPNPSLEGITLSGKRLQVDAALLALQNECEENPSSKASIRFLAPNPTNSGSVKLYFETSGVFSNTTIKLYSINGIMMQNTSLSNEDYRQGYTTIKTGSLPYGMYLVELTNINQSEIAKLIVW